MAFATMRIVVLALVTIVSALPDRTRKAPPPPACTTYKSGYLSADVEGTWKSFTVNSKNQIAYFGDGKNPLWVEFQSCPAIQDQGPGKLDEQLGQVYVPKYKKCIAITNQEAPVGPYWTILRPCGATGPSFAQKWDLRTVQNDQMYWVGETDEEGTIPQGGCGLLGYNYTSPTQVPWTTNDKWRQIRITCGDFPNGAFRLAKAPH